MSKKNLLKWSTALLAGSMFAGVSPASAQDQEGFEEIIVTAQKRAENLQDVPASITAIGNERMEELQISDITDISQYLPSVSLQAIAPGFNRTYFRGVASGENGNHSGPLPSVGTYLDEQPITTITGALDVHMYDMERVEALAGPQGTLYGASSQAGTIRFITNKPDASGFSAAYDAEVNSVENGGIGESLEGYVNAPLSENAAIRIVGWAQRDAGYIDNVQGTRTYPTCDSPPVGFTSAGNCTLDNAAIAEDDYNDVETYGARAALRLDLNDRWTITPSIMGQDQRSNGIFGFDPQVGDLQVTHWFPESSHDRWAQAALTVNGQVGDLDVTYATAYLYRAIDTESDYTDYSFFYDTQLGYGTYWVDDLGNVINPSQYVQGEDRFNKMSHEIRFASPSENRLRFVGGLFYQRQFHDIQQRYLINGLADAFSVPGWEDTIWLTKQERIDRDYAVFGEVSYDFTERLTGTAGLRFFRSDNTLEGFFGFSDNYSSRTGVSQCFMPFVPFNGAPCTNLDKEVEEDGMTHRLNVTYNLDDDRLIYATWSTGFRPGGVNRRGSLPPYDSDFLTSYEFGWKTMWAQNRVRFNGAIFFQEWEDFQYSVLGLNGLTDIQNAGSAEIDGLEMDLSWIPVDGLTLTASTTFLDAETTQEICDADQITGLPDCVNRLRAPSGTELPVTPDLKTNLTARYEFRLGNWDAFLQGTAVHQSESGVDLRTIEAADLGDLPAYTMFNFSGGLSFGNASLNFYINNAFDERAILTRYTECAVRWFPETYPADPSISICGAQPYDVPVQPRTIGVRFGQRF